MADRIEALKAASEKALEALRAARNDLKQRGKENTAQWDKYGGAIRALRSALAALDDREPA